MRYLVKNHKIAKTLEGQIFALLFYEPSSRTFSSFSAAIKRLGGQTIEYQDPTQTSSSVKGESLSDTVRTFETYAHGIVMRHFIPGIIKKASDVASIPVINAGDGADEHPTQALLDMYTIQEEFGRLNNLVGLMAGDILNGRTVHSLLKGFAKFKNNTIYLLSPKNLKLDRSEVRNLRDKGLKIIEIEKEGQIPKNAHFWYWTRVQKERFSSLKEYERLKHKFILSKALADKYASKNTIFMHPLPRVGEISEDLDSDPRAYYLLKQMKNGLVVRMAILSLIFGE